MIYITNMLLTSLAAIALTSGQNRYKFSVTEIPLPAGNWVAVTDLNDQGEICGMVERDHSDPIFRSGVGKEPKTLVVLNVEPFDAISSDGTVLTAGRRSDRGFIHRWTGGDKESTVDLPTGIVVGTPNSSGEYFSAPDDHVKSLVLHSKGKVISFRLPVDYRITSGVLLPDSGRPIAASVSPRGRFLSIWDRTGSPTEIPIPSTYNAVHPCGGNRFGEIVGRAYVNARKPIARPFIFKDGKWDLLTMPPDINAYQAWALDVNDAGQVLCAAFTEDQRQLFWLVDGKRGAVVYDLPFLKDGLWDAHLNEKGQVLFSTNSAPCPRAMLVSITRN